MSTASLEALNQLQADVDTFFVLVSGSMVFLMQLGFALLEAGAVSQKNTQNILFKNIMDAALGAIAFWLLGYGFAYGTDADNGFIGTGNFALSSQDWAQGDHSFFFQWAFAATAATIVSGSVAERMKIEAYFIYSIVLTAFVYPVVVHWVWDTEGWLGAFTASPIFWGDASRSNGLIDFAGCGVVHMVGGFAGLVGALFLGPRKGRFVVQGDGFFGEPVAKPGQSMLLVVMGAFFLWFGWYGFNPGSALGVSRGLSALAASVAVNTTLAASAGAVAALVIAKLSTGAYDLGLIVNGILAGLVSITAACPVVLPWHSVLIGAFGTIVYYGSSRLLLRLKIDDPLDAFPVHGVCGFWGLLAVGIFGYDELIATAYSKDTTAYSSGEQFAVQLVGALVIAAWTLAMSFLMFGAIHVVLGGMRVSEEEELKGLDRSEHGGKAYYLDGESGGEDEENALEMIAVPKGEVDSTE